MNARFVVAQAQPGSGSAPVHVIKITKPPAGQTEIYQASFDGTVKIDFTAIANLPLTFYHDSKDQTLHIIFADGSQAIIQPFFDSTGNVLSNLLVEVAPDQDLTGLQFAQQFPITEDQSVLPAAGGNVSSGADFHNPTVDPLLVGPFLPLLPPEELPPIEFHELQNALTEINLIPTVSGHVFGVVEEEQLNPEVLSQPTEAGFGNEDTHDASGNDHDTSSDSNITTLVFSGTLAGLVVGGDLPITFLVNTVADGTIVKDSAGNDVTSIGEVVRYHVVDAHTIEGWTSFGSEDARLIFTLVVNADGTFTFTLNDQIDHPIHTHDDGQGFGEETLNLDLSNAIHAHDANGDQVSFPQNTFDIGVIDDTPVAHDTVPGSFDGEKFFPAPPLDDEDQASGIAGGPGDDGSGTSVSGSLDFSPGADNYGAVSFAASVVVSATDGVQSTPIDQLQAIWVDADGIGHKEDVTLTWTPDGSGGGTLTGTTTHFDSGHPAFTLTVDKFGDYTFTLNAPLAHPFTDDPNQAETQTEFEDNLQLTFTYTVTDGDGDQADAHLTINVDDDVPTLSIEAGSGTVVVHDETPGIQLADEVHFTDLPSDVQTAFNGIANKGNDPDVGDDHGAIGYAVGALGLAHVDANYGADGAAVSQAITYALTLPQGNGVDSGLKTTEGQTIYLFQQTINRLDVIVGRIDADHDLAEDSQPGHFDNFDLHDPDDAAAFAITIDPNTGVVYLAQYLSLQHGSADINGDSSEPVSLASGTLSLSVTITDGDGDSITQTADVGGEIQFLDDGPSVSVDVDRHFKVVLDEQPGVQSSDDDTSSSSVRHLFDGVTNTGSDPDVSPKDHGAINFAVSNQAALDVHPVFGADGPKDDNHNGHADSDAIAYSLTLNGVSGKVDSGLTTTDGKHILLRQEGDLIVGRVDADGNGSVDGNDKAAFAIAVTDDGHVATALWLSLHHGDTSHTDDQDIVELSSGTVSVTVTVTDGDHDTASASADISGLIRFEDDGPSAKSNDTVVVEDDDLANGIDGGPGDDKAPQNTTGTLGHDYGADGPGGITLLGANLPNNSFSVHSNDGTTLIIQQLQNGQNVDVLKIVITDPTTGAYQVTQLHAIDHPGHDDPNKAGTQTSYEDNLDFIVNYRVTDGDGDHADGSIKIDVDDDSPDPHVTLASGTLIHDETPGIDGGSNDVAPSTTLDALFAAVTNKGNDPDVADLPGEDAVIGYAQQNASALVTVDPRYGADGPGSVSYGLALSSDGVLSGLQTTDGHDIALFKVNDHLIVGRFDGSDSGTTIGTNDPAAFAINIDPTTGLITVVQYMSIKHDDRGDPNESNDNGTNTNDAPPDDSPNPVQQWITDNALKLTVTVTDHDGDSVTTSTNIGHKIIFLDDGPTVAGVTTDTGPNLIQNGSFEQGHDELGTNDWSIYQLLPGWTWGPDHVPFEVQTSSAGGLAAEDGTALIELDGDTQGNPGHQPPQGTPDPNHTNATIEQAVAGTVAGQTYELTFYYSPRPGHSANDDSGLKVLWNGTVIDEIDSSNLGVGWQKITLHVVATGNDTLAFQATGSEDEFGALIDNVSLNAVTILDDEDTTLSPAVEIQGGPGDDGHGVVAHGTINFNAGADGLASIVVSGPAGLKAIFVDSNGIGHPEDVSYAWTPDGSGGGTLTGTTTHFGSGNPVFTLTVDNGGHYTFTLNAPLDHPLTDDPSTDTVETSFEDNLNLGFGFTITDGDGDTASGTLTINVDDDSPAFLAGGIEDATVSSLNTPVTESLNLAFGADGENADHGLVISAWPDLPGVTETLSSDGKTLTATIDGTNGEGPDDVLYVLKLNDDGTYTFTQENSLPGGTSVLPTVTLSDAYGPVASHDYDGFTLNGLGGGLLNGSSAGVGVNDNNMNPGDQFQIVFDNPMQSAILGIDFAGNGHLHLHWIARDAGGNQVDSGNTASFNADGSITIDPMTSFSKLDIKVVLDDGNPNSPKFKLTSIGGDTESVTPIDSLTFQVTGTDGDGDAVADSFNVHLATVPPLAASGTFSGTVEEEELGNTAHTATFASSFIGNEDTTATPDNDADTGSNFHVTTNVALGTDIVTGGIGPYTFSFDSGVEGHHAQFTDASNVTSQGADVLWHVVDSDTLYGYVDSNHSGGYDNGDRVVFEFDVNSVSGSGTFTLYDNIDHTFGDNVEGTQTLSLDGLVHVADSEPTPQTLALDGSVDIIDDTPVATNDHRETTEGSKPTMNAILVLDFSLSMGDTVPNTGGKTRLQLMKEAVHDFLTNPDVTFNQVTVYTFGIGASLLGQFSDPAAADAAISALNTLSAGTNYAAATSLVDSNSGNGYPNLSHPPADITNLYFLSDGDPTGGTGLTSAQETAWTNFLNDSGNDPDYPPIDKVYAIGFSDINSTTFLAQIAPRSGDVAEIVSDPTALSSTLTGTLPPPETTGNVLTDGTPHDGFGADGPHMV
ncbi:MAG: VWA domain-containing protein, partial [Pseudolabrys sp.]|nr:VWA domain-containing protein [Pseudolabrys sp.]